MKIYIETDMTEMPKGCNECWHLADYDTCKYCGGIGENCPSDGYSSEHYFGDEVPTFSPSWCPLRTEKEIKEGE